MSDLTELYQEVILDHSQQPRNFRRLGDANRTAEGSNPLCGDQITVYVKLEEDVIQEISFEGEGCAISKASASLMTVSVKGKTKVESETLFDVFRHMVTGEQDGTLNPVDLGKLTALLGVKEYPVRVKCATLAWHTLRAALEASKAVVSTE